MKTKVAILILVSILLASCAPETSTQESQVDVGEVATEAPATEVPATEESAATEEPVATESPTESPTEAPVEEALFESGSCSMIMDIGLSYDYDVECGYLSVPENRTKPDSPTIRLPVAVFKSTAENPQPDPVLHLFGGPGGSVLNAAERYLHSGGDEILESRDYIMFDQRGTPNAHPPLVCPEYGGAMAVLAGQPLTLAEFEAGQLELMVACRDRLIAQGIDLHGYNSAQNAADVNDLVQTLGYEQVNLYGVSYGTRLGLTIIRDYPDIVRSAILDAVLPPNADFYGGILQNTIASYTKLFERCAADDFCSTTYPELEATFTRVVEELNANPVSVGVDGLNARGTRFQRYQVQVNGDLLLVATSDQLRSRESIPDVPALITQVANGDYETLSEYLQGYFVWTAPFITSLGMMNSVQCYEEASFESKEDIRAMVDALPPPYTGSLFLSFALDFDTCAMWGVSDHVDPIENEAVVSDIPVLLFSGEYDPATGTAMAELTAETLSNSFLFEFPGYGHGVMRDNTCALQMGLAFLDDPTTMPDASCMADIEILPFR